MKKIGLSIALILIPLGQLNAAVMTFNGILSDGDYALFHGSYSESGFTMTHNSGEMYFIDNDFSSLSSWDDDVLEFDTTGEHMVTFKANSGGVFDFNSAYLGSWVSSSSLTLEGLFDGGGSITKTISLAADTRTLFNFSEFINLNSLVITAPTDSTYAVMDDFTFNESRSIPEPATIALFGFGFAGLSFSKKRKTA